ncbi:uncharacterized protein LOC134853381 isoform X2 [Symsagittifera roscoffensis]|uniref:uncharacterized protein LOC134853381 isoform X2 n=1 Tax=Symsagittifera roscoffensis TaxID=84072 RepID=UPI00307B9954
MDLSLVPGSHEFSSFTNATRVTPREKQPKSYMFILDTPDQSEHEGSVKDSDADLSETQKQAQQMIQQWSEAQFEIDQRDRGKKRGELVDRYHRQYLEALQKQEAREAINPVIECEHCVEELKSDRPKEYLADYLDMIKQDNAGTKSQSEKSKAEDVKSLDEITCHMQATIEEHEDKLRQLEQRLKELSAGRDQSYEIEQNLGAENATFDVSNSYSSLSKVNSQKYGPSSRSNQLSKGPTNFQHISAESQQGLSLDLEKGEESNRFLVTDDWLKFGVADTEEQQLEIDERDFRDADIDEEIPRLRNVFLSKLVWDDDGDLAKRVDRQLIQYQRMAYKPRNRWSHKITVPQPFEMTIREYTRPKSESYSSKRIAKLLEERKEEEISLGVKAVEIPKSTTQPKFQRNMSQKKKRSIEVSVK